MDSQDSKEGELAEPHYEDQWWMGGKSYVSSCIKNLIYAEGIYSYHNVRILNDLLILEIFDRPSTTHIIPGHGCGNQQTRQLNGSTGLLASPMTGIDNNA